MPTTSSFTIVYLANDPETIDLPGAEPMRFCLSLGLVIFIALLDGSWTGIWVRAWIKQRRKYGVVDQNKPRQGCSTIRVQLVHRLSGTEQARLPVIDDLAFVLYVL